jgi:hypothetical protein
MKLINDIFSLHNIWQFIACKVGTRFIASAGMSRSALLANAVIRSKFVKRVINDEGIG